LAKGILTIISRKMHTERMKFLVINQPLQITSNAYSMLGLGHLFRTTKSAKSTNQVAQNVASN
jgi:predicted oxidoreductase